jgi:hypothetical protein
VPGPTRHNVGRKLNERRIAGPRDVTLFGTPRGKGPRRGLGVKEKMGHH